MNVGCWALLVLGSACGGESLGAGLERDVRADLRWTSRYEDITAVDAVGPQSLYGCWLCTDPLEVDVREELQEIRVETRGAARGGGGLLVRHDGGAFRVRMRIRISRAAWATNLDVGFFRLGGAVGREPALFTRFACHGGEGDLRHSASLTATGEFADVTMGDFPVADNLELDLQYEPGCARAEVSVVGRRDVFLVGTLQTTLPPGVYLLGSGPRLGQSGALEARVELVAIERSLRSVRATDSEVPEWLRGGGVGSGLHPDPIAEIAALLQGPIKDWPVRRSSAGFLIEQIHSLQEPRPDQDSESEQAPHAWLDGVAIAHASAPERLNRLVEPLVDEMWHAMNQMAPNPDHRRVLMDWAAPMQVHDLGPAQRAATLFLVHRLAEPPASQAPLEASLRECPSDFVASRLLDLLDKDHPSCKQLEEYLLSPNSRPRLAMRYAMMQSRTNRDTARRLLKRALDGGVCDSDLREILDELGDQDLLQAWRNARKDAPAILKAILLHQRWMGLGEAAASTAHALLKIDRSPDTVRFVVPGLLLAADEKQLRALLDDPDPEIGKSVRAGLRDDSILRVLRQSLIESLSH